jgi:tRNA(Arg) A34 adenosine deaminase TadA
VLSMEGLSHNLNPDFKSWKREKGIESDTGDVLLGLHDEARGRKIKEFEMEHLGISQEFDRLISLLPDPDSYKKDEFPFAASVVRMTNDGKIEVLARSTNMVRQRNDSTAHAEIVAIQEAQQNIKDRHLNNCIVLSTAQPCEMCAGAIRNTGVGTLVYAVSQKELKGKHVQFGEEFKPIRTVPESIDIDKSLNESGVTVFAGYKHDEVLNRLTRFVGTFKEYYEDPDVK